MKSFTSSTKVRLGIASIIGISSLAFGANSYFSTTQEHNDRDSDFLSRETNTTEMNENSEILVEVWSDYLCPWCYIGEANLDNAIAELGINATVVYKSFQSNPSLQGAFTVNEIAIQSGFDLEEARQKSRYIEDMASRANVELHMDSVIMVNTMDAHRLAYMAKELGKGEGITKRLFEASYLEAKNIADPNVLADLGAEFGISKEQTMGMLNSNLYRSEVQSEIQEGINNGLRGVPYFVINKKYSLSGAQPKEVFTETLNGILKDDGPYSPLINLSTSGSTCDETGCEIPKTE